MPKVVYDASNLTRLANSLGNASVTGSTSDTNTKNAMTVVVVVVVATSVTMAINAVIATVAMAAMATTADITRKSFHAHLLNMLELLLLRLLLLKLHELLLHGCSADKRGISFAGTTTATTTVPATLTVMVRIVFIAMLTNTTFLVVDTCYNTMITAILSPPPPQKTLHLRRASNLGFADEN